MGDTASFPLWLPIFGIGLWLLVGAVLSELARWPELAFRFPASEEPPGRTLHGQVAAVGIVGENNVTVLTVADTGLYMRAMILFRFRRRPVLVPWAEVTYVGERKFLWSRSHVLDLGGVTRIRVKDGGFYVIEPFLEGASSVEARSAAKNG
jgi:hypothetical protein